MTETQKIVAFAEQKRQDPLYDQPKLQRRAAAALINAEFADDVLLPDNDPTVASEQVREQLLENVLLVNGADVPVSPRDNHPMHRRIVKQTLAPIAQMAAQGDAKALKIAINFVKHWEAHLEAGLASGEDKKALAPEIKEIQEVGKQLGELQAHQEAGMPAGTGAQPPQPGQAPAGPQGSPQAPDPSAPPQAPQQ